ELAIGAAVFGGHLAAAARGRGAAPTAAGKAEIRRSEAVLGDLGADVVDDGGELLLAGFLGLLLELFDLRKVIAIAGHVGCLPYVGCYFGGSGPAPAELNARRRD